MLKSTWGFNIHIWSPHRWGPTRNRTIIIHILTRPFKGNECVHQNSSLHFKCWVSKEILTTAQSWDCPRLPSSQVVVDVHLPPATGACRLRQCSENEFNAIQCNLNAVTFSFCNAVIPSAICSVSQKLERTSWCWYLFMSIGGEIFLQFYLLLREVCRIFGYQIASA